MSSLTHPRPEVVPTRVARAALSICLLLLVSCEGGAPAPSVEESRTDQSPESVSSCPNQDPTAAEASNEIGRERVDVTGDGSRDEVALYFDRRGEPGCEAFLSVATEEAETLGPVWEIGDTGALTQPSLFGFVELDGAAPAEIILIEAAGASTQFAALYAPGADGFTRIDLPGSDNGLFPFGGSVGHIDAVGCAGDDELVVLQATPGDTHADAERQVYEVTRRSYRLEGTTLEEVDVERDAVPLARFDRYPELAGGPFGTCPAP
jgi:hypothetical protein